MLMIITAYISLSIKSAAQRPKAADIRRSRQGRAGRHRGTAVAAATANRFSVISIELT
jgi:hypothetical protein